jgi:hypothetical protein
MRTQSGLADPERRARQTWPGGISYSPHDKPRAIRRRNTIAMLPEEVGVHPSEAMVNCLAGEDADTVDEDNVACDDLPGVVERR